MSKVIVFVCAGVVVGIASVALYKWLSSRETGVTEEEFIEEEKNDPGAFCEVTEASGEVDIPEVGEREEYVDYTKNYIDSSEKESPVEEDPEPVIDKRKKPRLIKEEEFGETGNETETLKYWAWDDVLTTEENEELEQGAVVGDCLTKFGFKDDEAQLEVYIRNGALGTDYEVIKVNASFAEWKGEE